VQAKEPSRSNRKAAAFQRRQEPCASRGSSTVLLEAGAEILLAYSTVRVLTFKCILTPDTGDMVAAHQNLPLHIPVTSGLLISAVLTNVLWLVNRRDVRPTACGRRRTACAREVSLPPRGPHLRELARGARTHLTNPMAWQASRKTW